MPAWKKMVLHGSSGSLAHLKLENLTSQSALGTDSLGNVVAGSVSGYSLPTATSLVLGGIKVGGTLTISSGILNARTYVGASEAAFGEGEGGGAAGVAGYVPTASAAQYLSFLRGDGTWQTPTNTVTRLRQSAGTLAAGDFTFAGSGATTVSFAAGIFTISSTDTNTTYSVGDGGLSEKNFTATLKTKLDGIATSADNYSSWTISDSVRSEAIRSGDTLTIRGSGATSVTYDIATNVMVVSSTDSDTNTTYSAGTGLTLTDTTFSVTTNTFAAAAHSHAIRDITDLQTALDGKQAAGSYAASSHTHDDRYLKLTETSSFFDRIIDAAPGTLDTLNELAAAIGDDANFSSSIARVIAGKADSSHTHAISAITGLQTALDGKQASLGFTPYNATNPSGYITSYVDTVTSVGISGDLSTGNVEFRGSGATTISKSGGTITISSTDTDTNTTYSAGTGLTLTGTTFSVTSGTYAAASHTHSIGNVTGLQTALDGKQASGNYSVSGHTHDIRDITDLQTALDGKQASLGFTPYNATNPSGFITGYTETDTLNSVTGRGASTANNITLSGGGNTFNGHHYFSAYDANGNHYPHYNAGSSANGSKLNLRMFDSSGTVVLFHLNGSSKAIEWNGYSIWHAGSLTNLNQLSNGPGYITSYVDTVTSVGISGDLSTGNVEFRGSGATTISKSGGTITISSTDTDTNTTYSAGTGLTLTGTTFSVTSGTYAAASHNHDDRYYTETEADARFVLNDFGAQTAATAEDEKSGTWYESSGDTSWGTYKPGDDSTAGYSYNDAPGYIQYNIPTGYTTAYIGQLRWDTGAYFDVHAVMSDGSLVFRGRYLSKNTIENTSHSGNHDGQQIIKISGLDGMRSLRITNQSGRLHLQGIGWSKEADTANTQVSETHWDLVYDKPSSFTPSSHTHTIGNVTGLQTALDGKQASLGFTPYNATNPSGYITSYVDTVTSVGISGDLSTGNVEFRGGGATTISKSGGTITISSTDTDTNTTYSAGTGLTLTGTTFSVTSGTYAASSHTHGIDSVTDAARWWNNFGDGHGTRTSFDVSAPSYGFGWRYVQGSTNGPGTGGSQFYSLYVGLGNDYPSTGAGSYGMYLAIDRNQTNPYLSVRFNENNGLSSWRRINAGYADSAGAVAWDNVSSKPSTFSPSTHTHTIGNVTGLQTALDGKLGTSGKAADSETIDGIDSSRIVYGDGVRKSTSLSTMNSATDNVSGFFFYNQPTGNPFGDWTHWISSIGNSWDNNYGFQIAHAFHSDGFAVRRVTNGSFGSWRTIIDSGNIGSQSVSYASSAGAVAWDNVSSKPTTFTPSSHTHTIGNVTGLQTALDGKQASGDYSVSGHTHSIRDITDLQTTLDGKQASLGFTPYNATNPSGFITGLSFANVSSKPTTLSGYGITDSVKSNGTLSGNIDSDWGESFTTFDPIPSGTPPLQSPNIRTVNIGSDYNRRTQLAFDYASDVAYFRRRTEAGWFTWREFIHSGNIGSQTVANTNSISNALGNTHTWTGLNYFQTNNGAKSGATDSAKLQAYSTGNNSAFMSFHKSGYYAVNFGLDDDNVMRLGGWSAAANRMQLDMSGNVTFAGNVTGYSDARIKTDVKTIDNALEKVKQLRGVSFTRTDSDDRSTNIGVIAQEVLEIVPEVVSQDASGIYNVAYGNMAGLFIEAIKQQQTLIEQQQKQIDQLKALVDGLTK